MKLLAVFLCNVLVCGRAFALEPACALDDGFAIPSAGTMAVASQCYPGAESYIRGVFAAGAWRVPYGIGDLTVTTVHAGFGSDRLGISLSASGSGFELYGEEHEKLGCSFSPFPFISSGLRITRSAMRIRGFGHASAWSADAGVVVHPCESVFLAGSLEDINGAEIGESREPLDGSLRFAASWRMPVDVTLLAAVTKVRRFDPSLSAGLTLALARVLTLGVVGANEPDRFEFLCGVNIRGAIFSYRGLSHSDLDMTHGFSIVWYGENDTDICM